MSYAEGLISNYYNPEQLKDLVEKGKNPQLKHLLFATGFTPFPDANTLGGGTSKADLVLTQLMAAHGVNVDIRSCIGSSDVQTPWHVFDGSGLLTFGHLSGQDALVEHIVNSPADLVHISSRIIFTHPDRVQRLKATDKPLVWTITANTVFSELDPTAVNQCAVIICKSNGLKQMAEAAGIPSKKLVVIPNAINAHTEHPLGQEVRVQVRQEYNIPQDATVFVYAGRIAPEKQIDKLYEAWKFFFSNTADKNTFLFILGDVTKSKNVLGYSTQRDSMLVLLDDLKSQEAFDNYHVIAPGWVNVGEFLAASDFFVSFSHTEGMSNATLEASARAVPSIAPYQTPGYSDIIGTDGRGGFLFNIQQPDELVAHLLKAQCIVQQQPEVYGQISAYARARIEALNSPIVVAQKHLAVYENILSH